MRFRYVCPRCRIPVRRNADNYLCDRCPAKYPIVAGIPDFRVFADPWINLEDDRAKALRLLETTAELDLEATVRTYWSMTPETDATRAEAFVQHVLAGAERSGEWLTGIDDSGAGASGPWLDLGCGTGDLAAALGNRQVVAIDIAMRWLVVARKRLLDAGSDATLLCCCAEALPFEDGTFGHVASLGMVEHCDDAAVVAAEAARVLQGGGVFDIRTVNRYSVLGEPHVGAWGVGYLPRSWADRYVRWRTGSGYRHHSPKSPRELRAAMKSAGFAGVEVRPARFLEVDRRRLGTLTTAAVEPYRALRRLPLIRSGLAWGAPLLEVTGRKQ